MNSLQTRMLMVLGNVGGSAPIHVIRERGNIAKPLEILESNFRELERCGRVILDGRGNVSLAIGKTKATAKITVAKRPPGETCKLIEQEMEKNPDITNKELADKFNLSTPTISHHMNNIRAKEKLKDKPPVTVGELEDAVRKIDQEIQQENEAKNCDVLSAMQRLKQRLSVEDKSIEPIEQFQLKHDVLTQLAEITEDSISALLHQVIDDLSYIQAIATED